MRDRRRTLLGALIVVSTAYAAMLGCDSKASGDSADSATTNTGDTGLDSNNEGDDGSLDEATADEGDGLASGDSADGQQESDSDGSQDAVNEDVAEDSSEQDAQEDAESDVGESNDTAGDSDDDQDPSDGVTDTEEDATDTTGDDDSTDDTGSGLQSCVDAGTAFGEIRFKPILGDIVCGETAEYVPYSTDDFDVIACGPSSTVGSSCDGGGTSCDMNAYDDTAGIFSYGVQLRIIGTFSGCALSRLEVDGNSVSVAAYAEGESVSLVSSFIRNDEILTDAGSMRSFSVDQYEIPVGSTVDVITLSASEGEIIAIRPF